jgi:RNA polymerase primary sigma factor
VSKNDFLTDYLQSLYGISVLDSEAEYALAECIARGDEEALEKLVKHNLRFVVYTVRKLTAWNHSRVPQEDLIGLGNEALLKAATQWTPSNGAKFATYAKRFIIRGVERGLDNTENLVRIPIKVREEIRKMTLKE